MLLRALAPTLVFVLLTALPARAGIGIWVSGPELAALPTSGGAWQAVFDAAEGAGGSGDLSDYTDNHDVDTFAQALVAARLGLHGNGASYRARAADNIMSAIGTEGGSSALPNARNIPAYVFAADLIKLEEYDSERALRFREWITDLRYRCFGSRSFYDASEERPNNWGLMTTAARLAIALYLRDNGGVPSGTCQSFGSCNPEGARRSCEDPGAEIARVARIFEGWTGNRDAYAGFDYGDLDWQVDPGKPVGINPVGATIDGHDVSGVLPDDMRRSGGFEWPPPKENYVYEALQAALVIAVQLHRNGYDVWEWSERALLRAYQWLHADHFSGSSPYPAEGDDEWQMHVVNHFYGTNFPAAMPANSGKNMGWTDWVFGQAQPGVSGCRLGLTALRTAAGTSSCSLEDCDADENGRVTASDALALLKRCVGLGG